MMRRDRTHVAGEARAFLESLAMRAGVAASTQNQAAAALRFLYDRVIGRALGALPPFLMAQRPKRVPNVLEPEEVLLVLEALR